MCIIWVTPDSGRTKPEICFLSQSLTLTLMAKDLSRKSLGYRELTTHSSLLLCYNVLRPQSAIKQTFLKETDFSVCQGRTTTTDKHFHDCANSVFWILLSSDAYTQPNEFVAWNNKGNLGKRECPWSWALSWSGGHFEWTGGTIRVWRHRWNKFRKLLRKHHASTYNLPCMCSNVTSCYQPFYRDVWDAPSKLGKKTLIRVQH